MWIHPNDQIVYENKNMKVISVAGLYSAGQCQVLLEDLESGKEIQLSLIQFNNLHEKGEIQVSSKRNSYGYGY